MKKIICLLLTCILFVGLCGCSNDSNISTDDKVSTENQDGAVNTPTDTGEPSTETPNTPDTTPATPPELTEEEKAAQAQLDEIADCKTYIDTIKVSFCDYSVFDYKSAVALDYILASNESTPPEKSCSVVMVVDYGNKELKDKYNPRFSFSVPNISKKEDASGTLVSMNTWSISDTVTVYFYRFNKEVPISDMTYSINIKDLDIHLRKNLPESPIGFDSVSSLLESKDKLVKVIDGRTYILIDKTSELVSKMELKTENGSDKYFVDDTYIYIPLTEGAEITLS